MHILLKSILSVVAVLALVILIEHRLSHIYGVTPPDPLTTIFHVYSPK